jgi:hypothetical protein
MAFLIQPLQPKQDQTPLVMHWSEDQLRPIVALLEPFMPNWATDAKKLTVASAARDLVVDHLTDAKGLHYSRSMRRYGTDRYRAKTDPLISYRNVTTAMDILVAAGFIDHTLGEWEECFESYAYPTQGLIELLAPVVDVLEPRGLARRTETVILRDRQDKDQIDYTDTDATNAMREQLDVINRYLARLDLRRHSQLVDVPVIRRIFNGDFDRGGRLYCEGNSYQNIKSWQRPETKFIIDGEAHDAVEIDYASLHIRMAYAQAGKRLPPGDPYAIDGFERGVVKLATNVMFNAASRSTAIKAIARDNSIKRLPAAWTLARKVVKAIRKKHHRIKKFFFSDAGARFQKTDSDMAVEVLLRMIDYTGRCPLPMHDSFLVAGIDADTLEETMVVVARDWGLSLEVRRSTALLPHTPPTTTITHTPLPHSHTLPCWGYNPLSWEYRIPPTLPKKLPLTLQKAFAPHSLTSQHHPPPPNPPPVPPASSTSFADFRSRVALCARNADPVPNVVAFEDYVPPPGWYP